MSAPPQTAGLDDSVTDAACRLAAARIGALPIVDQDRLVGLVTTTDVLEAEVRRAMGALNSTSPSPVARAPASGCVKQLGPRGAALLHGFVRAQLRQVVSVNSPTAWQRVIWHPAMALAWLLATIYLIAAVGFTTMRIAALVIQSIWLIIAIANAMTRGRVLAWIYRKD